MEKILIVDDDQDFAQLLQMILEEEGYEVLSAKNGHEGYQVYLLFKPDLVMTDIQMPEENGLKLMGQIRVHNPTVKTIYMSGNLNQHGLSLEQEKKRYHASTLKKPFSRTELMRLLSNPVA